MIALGPELSVEETGLPHGLQIRYRGGTALTLRFSVSGIFSDEDGRFAQSMRSLTYQPDAIQSSDFLYTICRNVQPKYLANEIVCRGLMYVLVLMRGGTINGTNEWVRTRGHVNTIASGTDLRYPEVHEVLYGQGLVYLQNGTGDRVDETVAIPMASGDKVVIAPGWASMIVNTSPSELIVGTWRMNDAALDGQPLKIPGQMPRIGDPDPPQFHERTELLERGGMAHHVLKGDDGTPYYVPNPCYNGIPMPRRVRPTEIPEWGLSRTTPLLIAFHENPDYFRFLWRPQDYEMLWKTLYQGSPEQV